MINEDGLSFGNLAFVLSGLVFQAKGATSASATKDSESGTGLSKSNLSDIGMIDANESPKAADYATHVSDSTSKDDPTKDGKDQQIQPKVASDIEQDKTAAKQE